MRRDLAQEVLAVRDQVAVAVTDTFLARHPDWVERYGDRARTFGEDDARHHIDFLAAAVEIGHPRSFIDYAVWCRGVLESRGIAAHFLKENLDAVGDELATRLGDEAAQATAAILYAGQFALATPPTVEAPCEPTKLSLACRLYTDAAIAGRRRDALSIVREEMRSGATLLDVYLEIFQESLYEIGRRWASTSLTVAEEHMASAITQFVLGVLYEEIPPATVRRGRAVVTGVAGELHQIGANILADALEADGWDVHFLGTDMPERAILSAIVEHEPDLVGISMTLSTNSGHVGSLIEGIHRLGGAAPRVMVGGRAFVANPDLWREVGADGFAPDVRLGLEAARSVHSA